MANLRELQKRRKSVRNIKKITRTMELIATARFKKALDRAQEATAYTKKITELVADLSSSGASVSHPLLEKREETKTAVLLVLTGNRGLCGGYNSNVQKAAVSSWKKLKAEVPECVLEVSGKRGINGMKFQGFLADHTYQQFEDKPSFAEVDELASRYLDDYATGKLDRLDVAYTEFTSISKQQAVVRTLLPLDKLATEGEPAATSKLAMDYEFLPSAESILREIVPASFKAKLFKCFLDAAVSEQISRMVAMKAATENADGLIKSISRTYNRARQGRITNELLDIVGGVEALA